TLRTLHVRVVTELGESLDNVGVEARVPGRREPVRLGADRDGFRLGPLSDARVTLVATKRGFRPLVVDVPAERADDLQLALAPARDALVHVRDPQGRPVGGGTLRGRRVGEQDWFEGEPMDGGSFALAGLADAALELELETSFGIFTA